MRCNKNTKDSMSLLSVHRGRETEREGERDRGRETERGTEGERQRE